MTRGLFKSLFLHSLIIGLFMYGAEIFKKNKRFEITEIPLDIVDISDQTINKIDTTKNKIVEKKKSKKEMQSGFQPPKVKSKPKPPEFSSKK